MTIYRDRPSIPLALAAGSALALLLARLLASRELWWAPSAEWRGPAEWLAVSAWLAYAALRELADKGRGGEILARVVDRLGALAEAALTRGLAWVVGIVCAVLLLAWIPHYLTWPWFRDVDAFATMAQSWDAGILPYRDIRAYNFPGQIYVLWILGKTMGWGQPGAFYAVDAALVLVLGAALVAWSRRRLGGALPGLVAYAAFLAHYLNLEYSQVAQRDWQATCLVVLALLALQGWPGRTARLSSALLAAAAFAFRPHVVLFLPALASAVDEQAAQHRMSAGRAAPAMAEWFVTFAVGLLVAFAPLVLAGVLPDFLRGLSVAVYGGPYSRTSVAVVFQAFVEPLGRGWTLGLLLVGPLLSNYGPTRMRSLGRTWGLAMVAVLLYKPLHPVQHDYLLRPLEVISSVVVAIGVGWIVSLRSLARPVALIAVVVVLCEVMPGIPRFASLSESAQAFKSVLRGEEPKHPPRAAQAWLRVSTADSSGYLWNEYRDVLVYLRRETEPHTLVANVLRRFPFPPLNGPAGRLSPFLVESGICWMWMIDEDLDAPFAEALEHANDAVVVWVPRETGVERRMRLPRLTAVIERHFHPEARYGRIEVWRRTLGPRAQ